MKRQTKRIIPVIPYVSMLIGLYVLQSAWTAILLYHAGLIAVLVADTPPGLGRAIRSGWNVRAAVVGSIVSGSGGAFLYILWPHVGLGHVELAGYLTDLGLHGCAWWAFIPYFVIVHPPLEEAVWRYSLAGGRARPSWADAAFSGYHVLVMALFVKPPWVVVSFVVLVLAAWAWRVAAARWRGLGVPLITHSVADLAIVMAVMAIQSMEAAGPTLPGLVWCPLPGVP